MPELPEVEAGRRLVETHVLGSKITGVTIVEQGGGPLNGAVDSIVLQSPDLLEAMLLQSKIVSANRRGKQLFFILDKGDASLLLHFGMSGALVVEGEDPVQYINTKVQSSFPPKYTKFMLTFENGKRLAYADPRRLGRIKLVIGNPLTQPPLSKLAPDPLQDGLDPRVFAERIAKYTLPIKALLLDQEAVLSGIGNYLADEVLYQSGIHPKTSAAGIPELKAIELAEVIVHVVSTACNLTAANVDFPKDWLFHYRWAKGKGGGAKMPDGSGITFDTVGGRTTAIVESKQKRTFLSGESATASVKPKPKPKAKGTKRKAAEEQDDEGGEAGREEETKVAKPASKRSKAAAKR